MAISAVTQQRRLALDDSRPIWRSMLVFLVPVMLSNILQSASATFNSIYLGRLIGVQALAAASAFFLFIPLAAVLMARGL